jgi:hypothetical protein
MGAGRTGRHHGVVRTFQAMTDRDLAGDQIDQHGGNDEGREAPRPLLVQIDRGLVGGLQTANPRPDHDAGALLFVFRPGGPAAVGNRLVGGGNPVEDEIVDPASIAGAQDVVGIEHPGIALAAAAAPVAAWNKSGDPAGQIIRFEMFDRTQP